MRNAQGIEKNKQQAVVDFVKAGLGVAPFEQTRAYLQVGIRTTRNTYIAAADSTYCATICTSTKSCKSKECSLAH